MSSGDFMKKTVCFGIIGSLIVLAGACAGHKIIPRPLGPVGLPPIPLSVVLPPDSPISADEVSVTRLTEEQALSQQRAPSDLPEEFAFIEGFALEPLGTRFDSPARVRLEPEMELPAGTTLFLFWIGSSRHGTAVDRSLMQLDGSVTFEIHTFGFFIVAENTLIPRPSDEFLVFGYADRVEGAIPLTVDFLAVPVGGVPPYSFAWDFGDGGEGATGETVAHTYLDAGEYYVSVEAGDAVGRVSTGTFTPIVATTEYTELSSVRVEVFPANATEPLRRVFFASIAGGVPPFTYEWDFGDGTGSSERQPEHLFPDYGIYRVHLVVTDSVDDSVEAELTDDLRLVELDASPTFGSIPLEVTFMPSIEGASEDASAALDFGDGNSAIVSTLDPTPITHTYSETGTYAAELEVVETFGGGIFSKRSTAIAIVALPPPTPFIQAIHPAQAPVGDVVSIYGQDFGIYSPGASLVYFPPSVSAEIVEWQDTVIRVVVPDGAVDGDVYVARGVYESNRHFFNVVEPGPQPPVISLVSPDRGAPGTEVAIIGVNFGDTMGPTDRVMLNNLDLEITSWSDAFIQAVIPSFAQDGDIVVYHLDVASNGYFFDVGIFPPYPAPLILQITPTQGSPGDLVTIDGTGFGDPETGSMVFINTIPMIAILWSDAQIVVSVPVGAGNGEIKVLRGGYFSNGIFFKVAPSPPDIGGLQQL